MSKKKPSKHALPDKKRAPKKTGKRMPVPEDPEEVKHEEDVITEESEQELLTVPTQSRLPTMEDAAIEEIEQVARKYVKLRDSRMRILKEEVEQKNLLLQVMHRMDKKSYTYDDLAVEIVETVEKIRVKVKKDDED